MKVRVAFTVDIDVAAWRSFYDQPDFTPGDIRADAIEVAENLYRSDVADGGFLLDWEAES